MAAKKKGLGRGLDALFAEQAPVIEPVEKKKEEVTVEKKETVSENSIVYININDIKPNENQPRRVFDEEKISELANSIVEHGIIQPLVVRKHNNAYEIVAGERRWRASRKADLKEVPCIVRDFSDEENMLIAIIENMQREDLNPIEEAEGLNQMIKTYGLTQEEVSKSVGKSRPYITNALRLLKLPDEIQALVSEGKITTGHARAIINVENKKIQAEICSKIIIEGLSVRKVEELVAKLGEPKKQPAKKVKNTEIVGVENDLKNLFGTKVVIKEKGKKGTISLDYYNLDELNRLIELLKTVRL